MISLNKDNFGFRAQRYLKLFMRIKKIVDLRIYC